MSVKWYFSFFFFSDKNLLPFTLLFLGYAVMPSDYQEWLSGYSEGVEMGSNTSLTLRGEMGAQIPGGKHNTDISEFSDPSWVIASPCNSFYSAAKEDS